jgi:hypothetical protein
VPVMERQPNWRLARIVAEAGVSRLGLASRICQVAEEWGVPVRPAHTQVSRWLAGQTPRGNTPALIAEALSRKLGRRVSLAEIGMAGTTDSPELGLSFTNTTTAVADDLTQLWIADLHRRPFLDGAVGAAALAHPAFEWLLSRPAPPPQGSGRCQVGMAEVEAIRATAAMFADLDNRFGGAHARTAAVQYLTDQVTPLLEGRYDSRVGGALFATVAEFNLSVAWMSYDSGRQGLGRRYFLQSLNLAHHAGDRLLGASTLSAMSHQANYLGEHPEAARLARAALNGAGGHAPMIVQAQFSAMEARAAAATPGSRVDCLRALKAAEVAFERRRPGTDPAWMAYFDESELADEFAHCFRDLGEPDQAYRYATQCLAADTNGAYARSRTFSRIVLAQSLLGQGELEEACRIGIEIIPRVTDMASVRCASYLRDLHRAMRPHRDHPAVTEFTEHARPLLARPSRRGLQ